LATPIEQIPARALSPTPFKDASQPDTFDYYFRVVRNPTGALNDVLKHR